MKKQYAKKMGFDEVPFPRVGKTQLSFYERVGYGQPFPYAGKTQVQREEDAYMEFHGRPTILESLHLGVKTVQRMLCKALKMRSPRKKRPFQTRKRHIPGPTTHTE